MTTPPLSAIPLALYIHFPWCVEKCPYCDFNSHPLRGEVEQQRYVDALIADLEQELPEVWGRRLVSIFIGGGTPSLMAPAALERLLSAVRAHLGWRGEIEITLEANPGAVERGRLDEFLAAGVNRLSIGIQSFDDTLLQRIGRIHSRAEALAAVELARNAGCDNLNLDLMFGLPAQSAAQSQADIATAITLAPEHLSFYQLTIEPNTAFAAAPPRLPQDEQIWTMQESAQAALAAAGYQHYEVSAYARPGRQCRHNLNYWQFGDYLGIGPGAHAKLSFPESGRILRRWKVKHPQRYLETAAGAERIAGEEVIPPEALPLEFMMNALRLADGFPLTLFQERTGLDLAALAPQLDQAEKLGLLQREESRLYPTSRGINFLNELLHLFM